MEGTDNKRTSGQSQTKARYQSKMSVPQVAYRTWMVTTHNISGNINVRRLLLILTYSNELKKYLLIYYKSLAIWKSDRPKKQ